MTVIAVREADFLEQVVARSKDVPVLVDFWAPWCGPCRVLGPILEQLAAEAGPRQHAAPGGREGGQGRFLLAKVDTDESPGLAQRFQIRSIPACKLFRDGQVVGEFVGALPVAEIRAFLDKHIPDESTVTAQRAAEQIAEGDYRGADEALKAVSAESPLVLATKARAALLCGRADEALALAARVPATSDERELADAVELAGQLAQESRTSRAEGVEGTLLSAGGHLDRGELVPALDALLEVVRKDRKLRDDVARKTIIALFSVAGVRSETSDAYRRKLADVL